MAESQYAFFRLLPWLGATSYSDAVALYGRVPSHISPYCQAITVNHGQFSCLSWGAAHANPWGFSLCTLFLLAGGVFIAWAKHGGKGLFCAEAIDFLCYRINTVWLHFDLGEIGRDQISSFVLGLLFVSVFLAFFFIF
jgi:hypothetical protein